MNKRFNNFICILVLLLGSMSTAMAASLSLDLEVLRLAPGETRTISVVLNNEFAVKTLQADVVLPEGLEMVTSSVENGYFELSSRIVRGMDIQANKVGKNSYRMFLVPSSSKVKVAAGEGEFVTFDVKATNNLAALSEISISNASVSDVENKNYDLDDFTAPVKNADIVPELILSMEDVNITVGTPSMVDVSLANTKLMSAMQFDVLVPSGVSLDTENMEYSDRLQQSHAITIVEIKDNLYRVTVNSASNGKIRGDEGVVLSLYMNATSKAQPEGVISVSNQVYSDAEGNRYLSDKDSFTVPVTVDGTQVRGDVNLDTFVNSGDINAVLGAMSGDSVEGDADVNGDTFINSGDINAVLEIMSAE